MRKLCRLRVVLLLLALAGKSSAQSDTGLISNNDFILKPTAYGLGGIWKTNDVYPTNYIQQGRLLGEVQVRYKTAAGATKQITAANGGTLFQKEGSTLLTYPATAGGEVLLIRQRFELNNGQLTWWLELANTGNSALQIEDLVLPLGYSSQGGENPEEIFKYQLVKHHFIEGDGSYIFWERPTGVAPYLVMTPKPGTSLEYFTADSASDFRVYIHAAYTGKHQKGGNWRQPLTRVTIPAHSAHTYGFSFHWAGSYQQVRDILVAQGLPDIHVMPGMTIPSDLTAEFALRTRVPVNEVTAEFPQQTHISYMEETAKGVHRYKAVFSHLGENRLTIRFDKNRKTYLEFFVTEPLETLYKKRAAFIAEKQQHRDSTKWYDGVFSVWDMKNKVLRGPDNTDGFDGWWGYVLTCDDPALCKAPFLAAKNLYYPDKEEIEAIEYYLKHFVWGGLQRTDKELPYPYGIYGTPDWHINRDTALRRAYTNKNLDKMHVWRSYDYPHLVMLYYHMYQIASRYPGMTHYLDKAGYLQRAKETAKAYFTYPYEILPWYETYKWGCYNELLLPDLMADLEKEGFTADAAWLRKEWEKKVKYFIYDDPYPFRSEYAIDATAFESTEAFAAYGVTHDMQPDSNLWYDKNLHKWYSHPVVTRDSARAFMERQMQANIACRGWLEPAYYYYGSDYRGRSDQYTLSYMAQMGGWSILDYGLHYAANASDYIRLGYGSYLSSFALMNTGSAASGYGAWYPGKENDGASGWAFEPLQYSHTWIRKDQGRGPWFYDGEIDLGYGGATRAAATIVAFDSIFGWVAYGGDLSWHDSLYSVIPKDGLRQRICYKGTDQTWELELDRDGWAAGKPVVLDIASSSIEGLLENRTGLEKTAFITVSGMPPGTYVVKVNGAATTVQLVAGKNSIPVIIASKGTTHLLLQKQ